MTRQIQTPVSGTPSDIGADSRLVVTLVRTIWSELPLFLAIDVLMALAALPVLLLALAGAMVVTPVAAALLLGPLWIAAIALSREMLDGNGVTVRSFFRFVRIFGWSGIRVALVPAIWLSLTLATLDVLGRSNGEEWMLVPAVFDGILALLTVVLFFPASLLAVSEKQHGLLLWKRAGLLAIISPVATFGLLGVLMTIWIATRIAGPLVIALSAAPVALFTVALFRWALAVHRIGREQ